ncbi:type II secretion system F family protein [Paucibacter sp. APW11]|uniref:Type II secretion system F family protein n=1 Tax=Roseateles aquae TaxID=3077235 RepID=A0ABU3P6G3_9BURK|nr:type II secretion system F family protein [Paucibacter sp. APW11]MDT8997658.1 type II secretion system F family protein [Paucibacter sp. APW11]
MDFLIRLFDPRSAEVREARVDAASKAELEARFAAGPEVLLSAEAVKQRSTRLPRGRLDVAWWARELRTLLMAGMTVVEAVETLNTQMMAAMVGQTRAQWHEHLLARLREGQSLSQAMQSTGSFPAVLIAGVRASERTSNLVDALNDYLGYHEMLERLRKQLISASIYPALVVGLGTLISLFLLLFVVPRFSQIYNGLHGQRSTVTSMLLGLSQLLQGRLRWVLLALALLLLGMAWAWRSGRLQDMLRAALLSIGPLRRQWDEFLLAKLFHSLTLMYRGGYALDEALRLCAGLELGAGLRERMLQAEMALMQGQRVSAALGEAGLTDLVTRRLLAVGERTGNFDRILQTIAERHAQNFSTFIERTTRLVEPVLLLLVALLVGGLVVMMYMPIFDVATSVS